MEEVEEMRQDGLDSWLVKYRCPWCGTEEWVHRGILRMEYGGKR